MQRKLYATTPGKIYSRDFGSSLRKFKITNSKELKINSIRGIFYATTRAESKNCMNSALYEYRNLLARRGAQFVPMGMAIFGWKTFPGKTTKMLSTRNSSILMMSSSVNLLFKSECSFTK